MGRISKIPDTIILDSIRMIDSGEISLRARAKEINMAHTSLMKRIKKIRDYWEENNIPESKRYGVYENKIKDDSLKTTTYGKLTTTNNHQTKLDKMNDNIIDKILFDKKEIPIRKPPTAREYSGLDYYQLDMEQLRMFYRLLTGRVDKSKGGKASSIKTLIPAIIEGLEFNEEYYNKKGGV